jgi:hypothetical protein
MNDQKLFTMVRRADPLPATTGLGEPPREILERVLGSPRAGRPSAFEVPHFRIGSLGFAPIALAASALLAALALVPVGGASLGSRAIDGISGMWRSGQLPPAPRPYQPGDQVWTTQEQVPPPGEVTHPPAGYVPPLLPHLQAPPPYKPGDKLWTSEPPQKVASPFVVFGRDEVSSVAGSLLLGEASETATAGLQGPR